MILQALCAYYDRMIREPGSRMSRSGFTAEKISYALVLRPDGSLAGILDLQETKGKKKTPKLMMVPKGVKRSSNVAPNFLWDNTGYVLGVDGKGKPEHTAQCFAAFRQLHLLAAREQPNPKLEAIAAFLEAWTPARFHDLPGVDTKDLLDKNCVFYWQETFKPVHEDPEITRPARGKVNDQPGMCLVSGQTGILARLHPSIKGVWGGKATGGSLVSFNCDAFTSYGKNQSYNAPVTEERADAYTNALNYLLNRDNRRCVQIADASTVFWAEKASPGEDLFHTLLEGGRSGGDTAGETAPDDEPAAAKGKRPKAPARSGSRAESHTVKEVEALLTALKNGMPIDQALPGIDPAVRFYVLGLAPNAARINVRFWLTSTFGELAANVGRHYQDSEIEPAFASDPQFPTQWHLLVETAVQRKTENILPTLAAGLFRAILSGSPYPQSLLQTVIGRIRVDKRVTYPRAFLIKGCLVRTFNKEIPLMLDETRTDTPYLLGRLFALLEKAQTDALGNIDAGVRDRFIGAASATPGVVFPRLLRTAQFHLAKSEYHRVEKGIRAVMDRLDAFPAHLPLEDQGTFFIGY